MPFQKIQPEKLSGTVVKQIELLILRGILRPGDRLPAERELAEKLGVSRPSLREAVATLQDRQLLAPKAGAGIFVADVMGAEFSETLVRLFSDHEEAMFDYISFRRDMEGMAAERAATSGSDTDLQVIDTVFRKMEAAHAKRNPAEESQLDAEFHLAIIEASHNVVMLHMMRAMSAAHRPQSCCRLGSCTGLPASANAAPTRYRDARGRGLRRTQCQGRGPQAG